MSSDICLECEDTQGMILNSISRVCECQYGFKLDLIIGACKKGY